MERRCLLTSFAFGPECVARLNHVSRAIVSLDGAGRCRSHTGLTVGEDLGAKLRQVRQVSEQFLIVEAVTYDESVGRP